MFKKTPFILLYFICCFSCVQLASEVKSWVELNENDEVFGKYHHLSEDNIKLFLPEVFKKYSLSAYQEELDSLLDEKEYKHELHRLNMMKSMKGNFHIFFDKETKSTYTLNSLPYTPLYKRDAQFILGMIRKRYEAETRNMNASFEKVTAKYNSSNGVQLFKVIYKIRYENYPVDAYNTSYIISSNKKTVMINLTTPFDVYFDPFIQKTIL
ncbi:hypothetical protein [Mangrovimonas spongiae]|uniref:DUF4919 domain-containing protein n=1 Tax=Mangrovimonas spongiae TaxID=2494697 RepID=A0A3R9MD72_9FLAO|nr:hypothetical protein [Mangrovimonas spongiae]RSK39260.1 hypothetical protein EJA19_10025 [Mangrovimonas spongiae]